MDDHFIINLRVANKKYPIKIKRSEEIVFRSAAREVDYKLSQYRNYFTKQSTQPFQDADYMAMTAIQAVSEEVGKGLKVDELESKIAKMVKLIDNCLEGSE